MKVVLFSDGHGNLERLEQLAPQFREADLVLYGGDFAAFGDPETGLPYLERLAALHDQVFAVSGNCDPPDFRDTLEQYDMGIEGSLSYFNGLMLAGSGGASHFKGDTPFERDDEELASDLHIAAEGLGGPARQDNLVIIAHNPPKDTALDLVAPDVHVGSPRIREFIEQYQPLLVLSGHIHESAAVDRIGETVLVNPGSLALGQWAEAELLRENGVWKVADIQLKSLIG